MDEFGGVLINSDEFGGILIEDEVSPKSDEFGGILIEDDTPTQPQLEQPISPDLKDKLNDTPWYESVLYEVNKAKHKAIFGATEGAMELGTDLLNFFGADVENPLAADKPNPLRDLAGAASGVSQEEFDALPSGAIYLGSDGKKRRKP